MKHPKVTRDSKTHVKPPESPNKPKEADTGYLVSVENEYDGSEECVVGSLNPWFKSESAD